MIMMDGANTVKYQVCMLQFFAEVGPTCSVYSTSEHEDLLGNCLTLIKEQGRNCLLKWHLTVCICMTSVHCYEWKSWSFVFAKSSRCLYCFQKQYYKFHIYYTLRLGSPCVGLQGRRKESLYVKTGRKKRILSTISGKKNCL